MAALRDAQDTEQLDALAPILSIAVSGMRTPRRMNLAYRSCWPTATAQAGGAVNYARLLGLTALGEKLGMRKADELAPEIGGPDGPGTGSDCGSETGGGLKKHCGQHERIGNGGNCIRGGFANGGGNKPGNARILGVGFDFHKDKLSAAKAGDLGYEARAGHGDQVES